jgi:hypothetical protein
VCVYIYTHLRLSFNDFSKEHAASIFKVEVYRSMNWFGYIGRVQRPWSLTSNRGEGVSVRAIASDEQKMALLRATHVYPSYWLSSGIIQYPPSLMDLLRCVVQQIRTVKITADYTRYMDAGGGSKYGNCLLQVSKNKNMKENTPNIKTKNCKCLRITLLSWTL